MFSLEEDFLCITPEPAPRRRESNPWQLQVMPPDIVDGITQYVSYREIGRMWCTGSRALMSRMVNGGVTKFEMRFEVSGDRNWPELCSRFMNLRELVITAPFGVSFRKINISSLPRSLKKIKLGFNEAESCWYSPHMTRSSSAPPAYAIEMLSVESLFPSLECLELAGAYHVSNDFIRSLPKSTTQVSIQTVDDIRPPGTPSFFDIDGVACLPPELADLTVHGTLPWTAEDVKKLPAHLTALRLIGSVDFDGDCLAALPTYLHHLECALSKNLTGMEPLMTLPKTLTSLTLRASDALRASAFQFLPRGLLSMHFGGPQVVISQEDAKFLPKTLTSLELPNVEVNDNNAISALPSELTRLVLVVRHRRQLTEGIGSLLPRKLTHLYISDMSRTAASWGDRIFKNLPPTLLTLAILPHSSLSDACIHRLPQKLTDLDLNNALRMTDVALRGLPRTITRLNIRHWSLLNTASVALLPRDLESLSLLNSYNITDDSFKELPPNLTHLELRTSPRLTDECAKYLPPRLRSLYLPGSHSLTEAFTRLLPTSITSVQVSDCTDIRVYKAAGSPAPVNSLPAAPDAAPSASWWNPFSLFRLFRVQKD